MVRRAARGLVDVARTVHHQGTDSAGVAAMARRVRRVTASLVVAVVGRMVRPEVIDHNAVTASGGKEASGTIAGRAAMMDHLVHRIVPAVALTNPFKKI